MERVGPCITKMMISRSCTIGVRHFLSCPMCFEHLRNNLIVECIPSSCFWGLRNGSYINSFPLLLINFSCCLGGLTVVLFVVLPFPVLDVACLLYILQDVTYMFVMKCEGVQ